jgi:hypothetical protein
LREEAQDQSHLLHVLLGLEQAVEGELADTVLVNHESLATCNRASAM